MNKGFDSVEYMPGLFTFGEFAKIAKALGWRTQFSQIERARLTKAIRKAAKPKLTLIELSQMQAARPPDKQRLEENDYGFDDNDIDETVLAIEREVKSFQFSRLSEILHNKKEYDAVRHLLPGRLKKGNYRELEQNRIQLIKKSTLTLIEHLSSPTDALVWNMMVAEELGPNSYERTNAAVKTLEDLLPVVDRSLKLLRPMGKPKAKAHRNLIYSIGKYLEKLDIPLTTTKTSLFGLVTIASFSLCGKNECPTNLTPIFREVRDHFQPKRLQNKHRK